MTINKAGKNIVQYPCKDYIFTEFFEAVIPEECPLGEIKCLHIIKHTPTGPDPLIVFKCNRYRGVTPGEEEKNTMINCLGPNSLRFIKD